MHNVYAQKDWRRLRKAGRAAAATLDRVERRLAPGVTGLDVDAWVRADTRRRKGTPSQLGYHGFPASVCVSPNDVVCHGLPGPTPFEEGDIVNVDVTTQIDGWHGDTSRTFILGAASAEARHVVDVAKRCLDAGIAAVKPGGRLGDVGAAIASLAWSEGCDVVREYGGHGIGRRMHLPPHVNHVAQAGTGPKLVVGFAFTIEPMIVLGSPEVQTDDDGWTVRTADGAWTAQFEHTCLVTEHGVEVLTMKRQQRR